MCRKLASGIEIDRSRAGCGQAGARRKKKLKTSLMDILLIMTFWRSSGFAGCVISSTSIKLFDWGFWTRVGFSIVVLVVQVKGGDMRRGGRRVRMNGGNLLEKMKL
ncbi:NAC domain-containing protein 2-like [Pyrus ussuriensis x Pyrus communis]|uniref:NAC domain-containing protein 2-like n=1 Tax=Pyrus ussuriensis x Pyrus communis TaxID=2448454 RepID=A0A5N5HEC5_9ROSA|nr:NAC domain-containing protein 2-like [Pyrus ussuriensis x Pyrus communis]